MANWGSAVRGVFGSIILAVSAAVVAPAPSVVAAPVATPTPALVSAEQQALTHASEAGVPVQVAGSQTETSRAWATPDGELRYEAYAVPRWVGTPSGGWRQINKRLRVVDGVVSPVATLADTRFSAGGSAPAITVPLGDGSVSFSWPSALPVPRLEYDTAVYESVLDGVDLRVRALEDGFTCGFCRSPRTLTKRLTFGASWTTV